MSAINETIVREFFELLGYFVIQPRKHVVAVRLKGVEEEFDLAVLNPTVTEHKLPDNMVWTVKDLKCVGRAIVAVRGWHTERFYVSTFEQTPDILRFTEERSLKLAGKLMSSSSMAKILCLPKLAASGELKSKTIRLLREHGVDGVISFQTMLEELVKQVNVNNNYEKSDVLQVIRLLKNYDFIRDDQLDFFAKKRHKRTK